MSDEANIWLEPTSGNLNFTQEYLFPDPEYCDEEALALCIQLDRKNETIYDCLEQSNCTTR